MSETSQSTPAGPGHGGEERGVSQVVATPLSLSRPFSSWRSGPSFEVLPRGDAEEAR